MDDIAIHVMDGVMVDGEVVDDCIHCRSGVASHQRLLPLTVFTANTNTGALISTSTTVASAVHEPTKKDRFATGSTVVFATRAMEAESGFVVLQRVYYSPILNENQQAYCPIQDGRWGPPPCEGRS